MLLFLSDINILYIYKLKLFTYLTAYFLKSEYLLVDKDYTFLEFPMKNTSVLWDSGHHYN